MTHNIIIRHLFALQVDTNGYFLFRRGFSSFSPSAFPGSLKHIVAPFWADNDIRAEGEVSYEVHTSGSPLLSQVNTFIDAYNSVVFTGTWMVVAEWKEVPQFPHSAVDSTSPVSAQSWCNAQLYQIPSLLEQL